jgi:putative glutamine amidotransferase
MPAALIPWNYVNKLQQAGATVVLLPPDPDSHDAISRLDGLVMAGGADIEPARYRAQHQEGTDKPRVERDASELGLYLAAREKGIPVFGICRGLQIMAVAHGGSLHQHLPDVVGNTLHRDAPGTFNIHGASFTPGSLIAKIVGATEVTVNSSHHQGVDSPGDLTVTGLAEDGTIEVCEVVSESFVLGVQWHPEFSDDEMVSEHLFRAFVQACASD